MTVKTYEKFADMFSNMLRGIESKAVGMERMVARSTVLEMMSVTCSMFKQENPRFDLEKFTIRVNKGFSVLPTVTL